MAENMIVIREPKIFCFSLDWLKDVEFIIKSNEFLAENKIKNEID